MEENKKHTFVTQSAAKLADVFYHITNSETLQIVGGNTYSQVLCNNIVSIRAVSELRSIDKRERYIDFGPAVTLSEMLAIGRSNMPTVLYDALETIGTQSVRNLATLGGNICAQGHKLTLYAPLLALDARLEIKSPKRTRYINPFSAFFDEKEAASVPSAWTKRGEILNRIRVPITDWELAIFRRIGPASKITPLSASFVFLVATQKNSIATIRIAFAGPVVFRPRELENEIIGKRLPLKDTADIMKKAEDQWNKSVGTVPPIITEQFLNLLRYSLEQLR